MGIAKLLGEVVNKFGIDQQAIAFKIVQLRGEDREDLYYRRVIFVPCLCKEEREIPAIEMCFTKHGRKINLLNYQELKNTLKSDRFTRENRWISPHIIERRKRVAQTRLFARLPEDILQQGDSLVEITGPSAIGKDTICRKLTAVGEVVIPSSTRRRRALPDLDVKTFCEEIEGKWEQYLAKIFAKEAIFHFTVKEWEASYGLFLEELLSGFHRSNKEGKKWVFLPGGPEMASLAKESFVNLANPSESRLPTIIHLLPGDMDWMDNWVIQRDQLLRSLSGEGEPLEILKRRIQYHKKITEWYLPKADFTIVLKSKDRDCFLPKIEEILTALRGVASGATPP